MKKARPRQQRRINRHRLKPPVYDQALADLMREGRQSTFWLTLRSIIECNIAALEESILDDDSLSEQIPITRRDYVRRWRGLNFELLNLPESIIATLESAKDDVGTPLDFDPYARLREEILSKPSSRALD